MRGKLVRAHFCEHDRWQGRPLYEAVVEKCRELGIAGATVFRGLEGYGESCEMHRHHLLGHHQPIVVVAGDTPENIERLVPALESMMETGIIAVSEVELVRVTAEPAARKRNPQT